MKKKKTIWIIAVSTIVLLVVVMVATSVFHPAVMEPTVTESTVESVITPSEITIQAPTETDIESQPEFTGTIELNAVDKFCESDSQNAAEEKLADTPASVVSNFSEPVQKDIIVPEKPDKNNMITNDDTIEKQKTTESAPDTPTYADPAHGGDNPFASGGDTVIEDHDASEYVGDGDKPGEGIHF